MAWFYVLSIEASLFCDAALIRKWAASVPQVSARSNCTRARASLEDLEAWLRRKQNRGYLPRHQLPGDLYTAQTLSSSVGVFDNTPSCWHKSRT